jgi:hypothetical protein
VDLHIHSPISLHGTGLNSLITGAILLYQQILAREQCCIGFLLHRGWEGIRESGLHQDKCHWESNLMRNATSVGHHRSLKDAVQGPDYYGPPLGPSFNLWAVVDCEVACHISLLCP